MACSCKARSSWESHVGRLDHISIYGQESNATSRLVVMNPALRGIESNLGVEHADRFRCALHPYLRRLRAGQPGLQRLRLVSKRLRFALAIRRAPKSNANFPWVQHFIHHLAPQGMDGFVLANGRMASNQCMN